MYAFFLNGEKTYISFPLYLKGMVQNHYVAYFKLFGPCAQLHGDVSLHSGNMPFLCLFRPFFSLKKSENTLSSSFEKKVDLISSHEGQFSAIFT